MTQYTGGVVQNRRAILTINLKGRGGFEIWQCLDRIPLPQTDVLLGDIGIFAIKIKTNQLKAVHSRLSSQKDLTLLPIEENDNQKSFFVQDILQNRFQIVESTEFFQHTKSDIGGVCGAIIGVSDMPQSLAFYQNVLGFDIVLSDTKTTDQNGNQYHKVRLFKKATSKGAFNKLLGSVEIELVQILNKEPQKIYENKFWGDCGFIHICLDVLNMNALKAHAYNLGVTFSVDSQGTFEMDNASGRFCYVEDPDGTLIELVETHKIPILKKVGLFLDLTKRNFEKPLPDWVIKMLALSKVK
jgi:catechol 2,3-dioxygenase-like lactoylglutathione lyase family enzyme